MTEDVPPQFLIAFFLSGRFIPRSSLQASQRRESRENRER